MCEINYENFSDLPKYNRDVSSRILHLLKKRPMRLVEISKEIGLSIRTTQYHLKKLGDKLERRKKGTKVYWGLKSKVKE